MSLAGFSTASMATLAFRLQTRGCFGTRPLTHDDNEICGISSTSLTRLSAHSRVSFEMLNPCDWLSLVSNSCCFCTSCEYTAESSCFPMYNRDLRNVDSLKKQSVSQAFSRIRPCSVLCFSSTILLMEWHMHM
uniref:Putative secreted protein n=1 Tax=Ixodes ricinus TaxID=34613 RepID=A0A6B0URE6_IXORI